MRSWVELGDMKPGLLVRRTLLHLLVPNENLETDRGAKARYAQKLGNILVKSGIL